MFVGATRLPWLVVPGFYAASGVCSQYYTAATGNVINKLLPALYAPPGSRNTIAQDITPGKSTYVAEAMQWQLPQLSFSGARKILRQRGIPLTFAEKIALRRIVRGTNATRLK